MTRGRLVVTDSIGSANAETRLRAELAKLEMPTEEIDRFVKNVRLVALAEPGWLRASVELAEAAERYGTSATGEP
jgi:hypothetical protein